MQKAGVYPTRFGATFAAVFVLIYWLGEFTLSAVINHFELRCQLSKLLLLYYKICPCLKHFFSYFCRRRQFYDNSSINFNQTFKKIPGAKFKAWYDKAAIGQFSTIIFDKFHVLRVKEMFFVAKCFVSLSHIFGHKIALKLKH